MDITSKDQKHIADCIMLDTLGLRVKEVHGADLPRKFAEVSDDPQVTAGSQWSKGRISAPSGKLSFRVRGFKKSGDMVVEGSNAVHYQGHNIVSSNDVIMSAYSMLHAVKEEYELGIKLWRPMGFILGEGIEVTRADTPIMLKLPNGLAKGAAINGLAIAAIRTGINHSLYVNESVYFDPSSQVCSLKGYDKTAEMKAQRGKKPLPNSPNTAALLALAEQTIRFEAVYRQKYFKNDPSFKGRPVTPALLSPAVLAGMFGELLEKYNLRGNLRQRLGQDDLWAIRSPYRATVAHWQNGIDLLKMFDGNQDMVNRHHRIIKHEYKIDILGPRPEDLDIKVEIGEILRVENFIPVPAAIRNDPALFYERDMPAEWQDIRKRLKLPRNAVGYTYCDPNSLRDDD